MFIREATEAMKSSSIESQDTCKNANYDFEIRLSANSESKTDCIGLNFDVLHCYLFLLLIDVSKFLTLALLSYCRQECYIILEI